MHVEVASVESTYYSTKGKKEKKKSMFHIMMNEHEVHPCFDIILWRGFMHSVIRFNYSSKFMFSLGQW